MLGSLRAAFAPARQSVRQLAAQARAAEPLSARQLTSRIKQAGESSVKDLLGLHARYGARVRVGKAIAAQPGALRQTSLKDAVLDLLVCAGSRAFMGSHGSSFSDAIVHLRATRGRTTVADRHVIMQ